MLAGFPNKLFRADVLQTAVLAAVSEILMAMPNLKEEVDAAVRMVMEQQQPPKADQIAQLKDQKAVLSKKITFIMEMMEAAPEEAKAKIFILKNEQRQIDEQLRLATEGTKTPPQDPAALTASIIDRLKNLGGTISTLPTYQLRQVLAAMIASATISMTTYEVEIMLRIPPMAVSDAKTAIETLSLRQTSPSSMLSQAQSPASLVFARIDCLFFRESQKPCVRCARREAA